MQPSDVLTNPEATESIAGEWLDLASRSANGSSYFSTPDWILAWWKHIAPRAEAEIAVWRGMAGEVQAVVALARMDIRLHPLVPVHLRPLTNMGSGPGAADHCGWSIMSQRSSDVQEWLSSRAAETALLMRNMDPSMDRLVPSSARPVGSSACPRLNISSNGLGSDMPASFRKKARYYTQRLHRLGVTFEWIPPTDMTAELLKTVFDLHARRRTLKDDESTFTIDRQPFHLGLLSRASQGRGPTAVVARQDEEIIGILYGFLWERVFSYYQSGWLPAWAPTSLGTALIAEAIRLSSSSGVRTFDFLRGREDYKYRFGAVDRIDRTWLVPTGHAGRLLQLKYQVKSKI